MVPLPSVAIERSKNTDIIILPGHRCVFKPIDVVKHPSRFNKVSQAIAVPQSGMIEQGVIIFE